MRFFTVEYGIK